MTLTLTHRDSGPLIKFINNRILPDFIPLEPMPLIASQQKHLNIVCIYMRHLQVLLLVAA